jgi:hypothetical protein
MDSRANAAGHAGSVQGDRWAVPMVGDEDGGEGPGVDDGEVAEAAKGYKAFLVAADFEALAFLFCFNNWFRNQLLGEAANRANETR